VPRYADLPREQLTDAILYVNAMELRCAQKLAEEGALPFLQGKMGERFLIRIEGQGRYSVVHLGVTEIVTDLSDLIAIDEALDTWRAFAKRKELNFYREGKAKRQATQPPLAL